jgi:quercetin dioxygenase-like cupin family protein
MNNDTQFARELEDCAVDAALYVLGSLDPEQARSFEQRLKSGCAFCCAQAEHYAAVAEHLSMSVTPVKPSAELRRRLLDRIKPRDKAPQASEHMTVVRGSDAPWVKMPFPGVEIRPLIGEKTLMVRMQPGAVFPQHDHPHAEQCYVLEGSITDSDGVTLHAGDFVVMSSGIKHEPLHSDNGCTLFIAYAD